MQVNIKRYTYHDFTKMGRMKRFISVECLKTPVLGMKVHGKRKDLDVSHSLVIDEILNYYFF